MGNHKLDDFDQLLSDNRIEKERRLITYSALIRSFNLDFIEFINEKEIYLDYIDTITDIIKTMDVNCDSNLFIFLEILYKEFQITNNIEFGLLYLEVIAYSCVYSELFNDYGNISQTIIPLKAILQFILFLEQSNDTHAITNIFIIFYTLIKGIISENKNFQNLLFVIIAERFWAQGNSVLNNQVISIILSIEELPLLSYYYELYLNINRKIGINYYNLIILLSKNSNMHKILNYSLTDITIIFGKIPNIQKDEYIISLFDLIRAYIEPIVDIAEIIYNISQRKSCDERFTGVILKLIFPLDYCTESLTIIEAIIDIFQYTSFHVKNLIRILLSDYFSKYCNEIQADNFEIYNCIIDMIEE